MKTKQTFAVIVTSRNVFPAQLALQERRNITAKLDELGFGCVLLSEDEVPNGAVETYSDAKKCAALFKERRDEIDGVIVVLPNFGDEQAVTETIDMSQLNVPVLVQACDEADATKLALGKRRDSFCGKLSVCNNLYQYGIPFTNTTYHTCSIADDTLGIIKAYVGQGEFTDDPLECDGGVGVCEVPVLQDLLDFLCQSGFEHHVAMNRGHYADALEEAFGRYLGWDVYNHS